MDRPFHIAFVTPTYPPGGWGGIGTYVYQSAIGLRRRGVRVSVLSAAIDGKSEVVVLPNGVVNYRVLDEFDLNTSRKIVVRTLNEISASEMLDLVEFPEYQALGLTYQQSKPSVPVVVRLHADTAQCYLASLRPIKLAVRRIVAPRAVKEMQEMEANSVRLATAVSSPSNWMARRAVDRRWKDDIGSIKVIANPLFELPGDADTGDDVPRTDVLLLGRLQYMKGAEFIPEIVRGVHKQFPRTTFSIVGQSSIRGPGSLQYSDWILSRLPKSSAPFVNFSGGVSYGSVQSYVARSKIGVFMSTMESYGYTHQETMKMGLATVIGSKGGAQELGRRGIDAVHVSHNASAAVTAICDLLADDQRRAVIGKAGKEWVEQNCGSVALALEQHSFYQAVAHA